MNAHGLPPAQPLALRPQAPWSPIIRIPGRALVPVLVLLFLIAASTYLDVRYNADPFTWWATWLHEFGHIIGNIPGWIASQTMPQLIIEFNGNGTTYTSSMTARQAALTAWMGQGMGPLVVLGFMYHSPRRSHEGLQVLLLMLAEVMVGSIVCFGRASDCWTPTLGAALVPLGLAWLLRYSWGRDVLMGCAYYTLVLFCQSLWGVDHGLGPATDLNNLLVQAHGTQGQWVTTWIVADGLALVGATWWWVERLTQRVYRQWFQEPVAGVGAPV